MSRHMRAQLALYLMGLVAAVDQLSKWWVVNKTLAETSKVEVTSYFNIILMHNRGMTFGLLNNINHAYMPFVMVGIAVAVIALLTRWLLRTNSKLVTAALGLIMGGAIGNIFDRVRFGAVIDFLDFYYGNYHWYTFNVADAAIVAGVGLLTIDSLVRAP
ncbi:MAG: signal peptidase II [Alphaproteobacteria bacterium]|nr:signal peptidase II [Alphaproteobacteria bacterium]MBV8548584.1 signal peptidase II [Alphaproteobacteria bacterium]